MKIDYEEFNELQTQQRIRDYAQETLNILNCLNQIVLKKYNQEKKLAKNGFYAVKSQETLKKEPEEVKELLSLQLTQNLLVPKQIKNNKRLVKIKKGEVYK